MDTVVEAVVDPETRITMFTKWTPEEVEQYVMRENGEKEILWQGPNPYRKVPFVTIPWNPYWLPEPALTESNAENSATSATPDLDSRLLNEF